MRKVERERSPDALARKAAGWTERLLTEIERCATTGENVADKFFDKYRHDEVRDVLREMYDNLCCYCEARINIVSYNHIEHRMPKRKFPAETFCWDNLHLACEKCNKAKGEQWEPGAPILDACLDEIARHLTYMESETGLRRWPENDSERGQTTIDHADLDREGADGLPGERAKVYLATLQTIRAANELHREHPNSPSARAMVRELRAKCRDQFGSVIAWAMAAWLSPGLA